MLSSIKESFPIGKLYRAKRWIRINDKQSGEIQPSDRWIDEGTVFMLLDITPIVFGEQTGEQTGHCFKMLQAKKTIYANFLDDQPPMFIESIL